MAYHQPELPQAAKQVAAAEERAEESAAWQAPEQAAELAPEPPATRSGWIVLDPAAMAAAPQLGSVAAWLG